MPKPKQTDWRSLSDGEIIDQMGAAKTQIKKLEALADKMCAELLDRGVAHADGLFFHAAKVESYTQTSLDRKKLEADKGEAFVSPYLKFITVRATIKVTPRADVAAAAMLAAAE